MGDAGLPPADEEVARRVRALREALERSQVNTEGMVAAVDSFGNRVSAIDADVRPVQVRRPSLLRVSFPSSCPLAKGKCRWLIGRWRR